MQTIELDIKAPSARDWWVAIAVAVAAAAVILVTSEKLWFYSDAWPILANRRLSTFDGWTAPHGGHWLVAPTIGAKVALRLFEDEFYPGFFLPRVVLYAALSLAWWRVLRWRDVPQLPALGALLLISWLGTSGWMITVIYIGPIVVGLCALGSAWIIDQGDARVSRQIALFFFIGLAVSSSASGPALWAAIFGIALLTRQLKPFALPIAASGALYAWWYFTIARFDTNPLTPKVPGVSDFLGAPVEMARLIGTGFAVPLRLGSAWDFPLAALFFGTVAVLWKKGRFRRFDAIILSMGVIIVGLGVLVRGSQGLQVDRPNRIYLVGAYLLIGLLPPLLSGIRKTPAIVAAVAIGIFALPNLAMAMDEIEQREEWILLDRPKIETAVALIDEGEDFLPWSQVSPQAINRSLEVMVVRGWQGEIHPDIAEEIQGKMMFALNGAQVPRAPLMTTDERLDPGTNCIGLVGGRDYVFGLTGDGGITIADAPGESITVTRTGDASFTQSLTMRNQPIQGMSYVSRPRLTDNTLTIVGDWDASETKQLCGVKRA